MWIWVYESTSLLRQDDQKIPCVSLFTGVAGLEFGLHAPGAKISIVEVFN